MGMIDSGGVIGKGSLNLLLESANVLAMRNGTAAQSFYIYNTYTDASNYERLQLYWSSNLAYLVTNQAGTGSPRQLYIGSIGLASLRIFLNNTLMWTFSYLGNFQADANNTYDIGAISLKSSPKTLYLGTSLEIETVATLGSESLQETDFATHAKWDVTNGFVDTGGNAAYSYHASGGTLTQTAANLAVALRGNRWYKLVYTVSGTTGTVGAVTVPATVATAATALTITNAVGAIIYFKTVASPTDFVISAAAGSAGCAFVLDDLSLKEIQGGDAFVGGTVYGLNHDAQNGVYKVNGTQVVGARVIDARADDAINSGDATTDGVIDCLRDAMIAHGLLSVPA